MNDEPPRLPNLQRPSAWQAFITGAVVLLMGDHLGAWDFGDGISANELVGVLTAIGSALTLFSRGRRQA